MNPFDFYYDAISKNDLPPVDGSWGQGKTTFGGMSAALALTAIERDFPQKAPLRSLSIHFCGALVTEQPYEIETRELKSGRSISHLQAEVLQNDDCATVVTACYGSQRESDVVVEPAAIETGEPGSGTKLGYIAGLTPEFVRHIDFSYVSGGLPFTGSKDNHIHGWMRFNDSTGPMTEAHLVALIDAWPPATLQKLRSVAPCASITWSLELMSSPRDGDTPLAANDWLYYEVDIMEAHGGYAHTTAKIYRADGTLLALSRQLVVVYDKRS
ncbi:MAG: acyl-CoA thioesterase [Thalassolituus sp.]|jgi:acyl-CoA thioesterase|uniref:acyl-CoA thioesterase n=1 Tax=Thalassolituus sp. TaxID=2030822 RepID=UPI0024391A44|nr:thioesterase family protein [Pseudomonadota bacterium]MEC8103726.1 thioesterase family protein [Pseudomonadota bacterium]MEC8523069.1 thioesterase family protein [Pseudomonadota bacterium]MEE2748438.1 thioesterase family protein [Pseudomonadota bacterium]TNC86328.1 MAG: acyl-CoA thioesterase [Thalassolituus sp.]|tara:strand:+ start:1261 stop:2070 length:810 start_codon:yes stop_codon:yes gene_type:complete